MTIVRLLYTLLLYLALPLMLARLVWRGFKFPAYRRRWLERLGRFAPPEQGGGIWIHAVSVGEAQAIAPVVRYLLSNYPTVPLTVTTTTPTGSERVRLLFGDGVFHVYFPYDVPFAVQGFLDRVRPRWLVMVETEIWPNLLATCAQREVVTFLANARISAKSAAGYMRLKRLSRETFGRLDWIAAQAKDDADRFIALGSPADHVRVTGSLKFDIEVPASVAEQALALRRSLGPDRPVWVAASTHEGEDEQVLDAHAVVRDTLSEALLVLVPRHPERFDRVADLCRQRGLTFSRRSHGGVASSRAAVLLGDTMGELLIFLGASDAAFVGGSLVPIGGHNVLEASAQGVAVVFGQHMFNFPVISKVLLERGAAVQINRGDDLGRLIAQWLSDATLRVRIGEAGRRAIETNRGALPAVLRMLDEILRDGQVPERLNAQ